ncbi:DICT sensory domain-containing protein [Natronomonas sp.]|uniref:DICT sensory domain-containing protein n=1 Tax=Natronomonas sp. TaxID=2184060 RepID=UPI002624471F|nr:DICT sensory domain-containing protein [Natronomonas sp.]
MVTAFESVLSAETAPERTLAVVDGTQPEPVLDLFQEAFGSVGADLEFARTEPASDAETAVALIEDGEVVTTSPMEAVRNAVLLVNSDLYTSGLSGIDKFDAPDVLTELDDQVYTLRGFPESTKEKLLLIVMSRYIEARALEAGAGRLDAAFQELSRVTDEYGTERVYQRLADSGVEVHAYGLPDEDAPGPASIDGLRVHPGRDEHYRRSWFVVFSPSTPEADPAALLAVETDPSVWRSMWTYDPDTVRRIRRRIDRRFR